MTGNPVLLPKFGFYQGHLNAYNRDYWKEDEVDRSVFYG
ncbi:alpha-xylosidase domain protein [Bacteroides fragilis str. 3397 N2]|nr:alpha-xylosidase domain protein [Bacteroides fragilis str. 3397 N2]